MRGNITKPLQSDNGFTLVEMLVVIMVLGILTAVSGGLFISMFDMQVKSLQGYTQVATMHQTNNFFNSNLAPASSTLGLASAGAIDPLSIAGDQLIFVSRGKCYRVFYVERLQQIRGAIADTCTDAKVKPVRGPNEKDAGGNWIVNSDPAYSKYDQALDLASGSFLIADHVVPTPPLTTKINNPSNPLQIFQYKNIYNAAITVDNRASSAAGATHTAFYSTSDNRTVVRSIDITTYNSDGARVPTVNADQFTVSPGTAVSADGTVASIPGVVLQRDHITGQDSGTSAVKINGNSGYVTLQTTATGSAPLATANITSANGWLDVETKIAVSAFLSTNVIPYNVRIQLLRNGTVIENRYMKYDENLILNVPVFKQFQEAFKIPATGYTDDTSTVYKVQVQVANNDLILPINYYTGSDYMSMDYVFTAR